jgi:hypothetical protein
VEYDRTESDCDTLFYTLKFSRANKKPFVAESCIYFCIAKRLHEFASDENETSRMDTKKRIIIIITWSIQVSLLNLKILREGMCKHERGGLHFSVKIHVISIVYHSYFSSFLVVVSQGGRICKYFLH